MTSTLDGLPKPFVTAMRTLFDIMDDNRTGYVNFSEIENRWQDDGSKSIPKGVLESLRKVTPSNGLLSFERFCAGLKICLLRNQVEQRPPSAPLLDIEKRNESNWENMKTTTISQRTLSMPQLLAKHEQIPVNVQHIPNINKPSVVYGQGPPKPPRSAVGLERQTSNFDRAEIRTALQNWQMGVMMNDQRSLGDGKAETAPTNGIYQKKANVRRREPRRHTLQNGIDYNMLKRMKQIEQEKDVLVLGLSSVEKAREWYLKQISVVQEKMKYLGRMGHVEWSEAQQERLELQRARVLEVNRHLAALTDSWERGGLPLHMNLAVHHYPSSQHNHHDPNARLKQQNHMLTEEVGKKSERISVLEKEKASLIRELMQFRTPNRGSVQDEALF